MASPKTWTIVHFLEDNSVEAVPTKWINGTRCLWPMLPTEKLTAAIKKQEFNSHWPDSSVRVLRNATFSDYTTARTKAKKAEDFSDLNSTDVEVDNNANIDNTEKKKGKRRRIKKKAFDSSDEENSEGKEESEREEEPFRKKKRYLNALLPTPPVWIEPKNAEAEEQELNEASEEENFGSDKVSLISHQIENMKTSVNLKTTNQGTEINGTPKNSKSGCACNPAVLYNIQSLLVDIKGTVDKLFKNQNSSNMVEVINKGDILKKSNLNFPISIEENIEVFENFISKEENYFELVTYFSKLGGHNLYEFIKRCIAPILEDSILVKYSYIGRKGKKRFDKLLVSKAILESAEIANISKNKKETEIQIGVWLRKATERNTRSSLKNQENNIN